MFKNFGNLKYIESINKIEINLESLNSEINVFDNFIISKKKNNIKIFDRKCDHMGGKLISRGKETLCPIHMWKFNPLTGYYDNGIKKKEINFYIENNILKFNYNSLEPKIFETKKKLYTKIRFFNHAFLKISGNNFSFATDPWAIGPSFNTGWWLKNSTKDDWIEELNKSNFIYISHNHPDHLHPLSLSKVKKDMPIIVPNFISNSTSKYIEELGFKNIQKLEFNVQYNLKDTNLFISILKSGDFREDSGIYFSNGNFTGLLSVDSNMLNFERFPKVNFYGCSFASGASGYPLMFDNFNAKEQEKILLKDKSFFRKKRLDYLKKITPKYFMPYAGFFEEKLQRDKRIKKNNKKYSINDYLNYCNKQKIELLNVLNNDVFEFKGIKLIEQSNIAKKKFNDLSPEKYLNFYKKEFNKIDEKYIEEYFMNSDFKDNLQLFILLTGDNFNLLGKNYFVDFSKKKTFFKKISIFKKSEIKKTSNTKKLVLKIRKESFLNTIYNKLPWEDLSIGFQCKVLRNPNLYNVSFWYHFTNIYITSKNVRFIKDCGSC